MQLDANCLVITISLFPVCSSLLLYFLLSFPFLSFLSPRDLLHYSQHNDIDYDTTCILIIGYKPVSDKASTSDSPLPCIIPFEYMKEFMKDTLMAYGTPEKESEICADVLIEADKRGIDSHGIGRLKPIYCDRMDQGILSSFKPITIIKECETSALVDGGLGLGLYIGPHCMQMAIDKAKKYGVGFVAVQNSTHYGIAGYYATMASQQGCVGFTGTNARPSIAPTFGVEPMMGTNPLCFGIPTNDGFDFVIDCATSVNQRGKIERYAREGKDTPRGAVIDNNGVERTDTIGILKDMVKGTCALTPVGGAGDEMGGYKGIFCIYFYLFVCSFVFLSSSLFYGESI